MSMTDQEALEFDNSYARLPERFYARLNPQPVPAPQMIRVNRELALYLGIDPDWLASDAGTAVIAGNHVPPGAEPIAMAYAGHQFGGWNPQLGDGRAILLGELRGRDGVRHDLQLKGSGRTPWSRNGDGRAPLGPVLREYVVSEAMAALGVPTSRSLAAVTSGESVIREGQLPGAVLARVARSHIRIGTFEYFAAREDRPALELLADHVIRRHYPDCLQASNPVSAMLASVVDAQAALVARWQLLGFIHGVMNTDNMLLSGETIDYGPCAFMDGYDPAAVYSSIDLGGRYAYQNQPRIAHWNLGRLAASLLPLLDDDQAKALPIAQSAIDRFPSLYTAAYREGAARKLGLADHRDDDDQLMGDLLDQMQTEHCDFTLTFRRLSELAAPESATGASISDIFDLPTAFEPWLERWRRRLDLDPVDDATRQARMFAVNPAFIPRNHLVEQVISAAVDDRDFEPFHALVDGLARPFEYDPALARYATPPRPEQVVTQTFCGT